MDSNERYTLELPEMEEQHRYLYWLFDHIEPMYREKPESMKKLLREIEHYLSFHFTSEEHFMRMYEFPQFAAHQTDHENAATKFIQFLDDFESGHFYPAKMRIFLTGWLMEHSSISDVQYVEWIKKRRAEIGFIL